MAEPEEQETEGTEEPVSPETVIDADEADEEAEADETPASEPTEASAPKSEKEIDKALKAVERAGTTYRNAIGRAMGDDALHLEVCPRCNAPVAGMIFPPSMAPVDDETREAVLESVGAGAAAGPPLQKAEGVETCPKCLGRGQLEFPTFVEHVKVQNCVRCQGSGYVTAEQPASQPVIPFPVQPTTATGGSSEVTFQMPDSWGRPPGHPHYNIPPAQVGT